MDDLAPAFETDQFGQLLARALLFRIITDLVADPGSSHVRAGPYANVVELARHARHLAAGLSRDDR